MKLILIGFIGNIVIATAAYANVTCPEDLNRGCWSGGDRLPEIRIALDLDSASHYFIWGGKENVAYYSVVVRNMETSEELTVTTTENRYEIDRLQPGLYIIVIEGFDSQETKIYGSSLAKKL